MKEHLENTFSKSYIKPIHRTRIGIHDVFIADGFVEPEQLPMIQTKFGSAIPGGKVGRDEFPNGCWATIWMTQGKFASRGGISLCQPGHDNETLSTAGKQKARVNFAIKSAREALLH